MRSFSPSKEGDLASKYREQNLMLQPSDSYYKEDSQRCYHRCCCCCLFLFVFGEPRFVKLFS